MASSPCRSPSTPTRKCLTLREKINVIKTQEKCKSPVRKLALQFGVGKSQISDVLRRKRELQDMYESNCSGDRKRTRVTSPYDELNSALYEWFCGLRSNNVPVSGPLIANKALILAAEMGLNDFKASSGWLSNWKKAYNIGQLKVCGESADVDKDVVADWQGRLHSVCEGYTANNIYNADETGLFYRAFPDKSLAIRGQECKGGKSSKERVSVLLTVSMSGEKLAPWVIGKANRPRCFKGLNLGDLPCVWRANRRAWMTSVIFLEYLRWLNRKMALQCRNILLFVDNAPCHPHDLPPLPNVNVKFLPPNTTCSTQPCDLGIIQTVKVHYRKQLLTAVIARLDGGVDKNDIKKSVNVYDAVQWLAVSWKQVKPSTVTKCFQKAGFTCETVSDPVDDEDDIPLSQLQQLIRRLDTEITAEEYVEADHTLATDQTHLHQLPIAGVNTPVIATESTGGVLSSDEDEDVVPQAQQTVITDKEFYDMVLRVSDYAKHKGGPLVPVVHQLRCVAEEMRVDRICRSKQTSIKDFFKGARGDE